MTEVVYKRESYAIIGACFDVYNEKGCGFLEPGYQECLGIEFEHQRIPAIAEPSLVLNYREFWAISGLGIRTDCENAAHKSENRLFQCSL
jgi:GxxExxY protein